MHTLIAYLVTPAKGYCRLLSAAQHRNRGLQPACSGREEGRSRLEWHRQASGQDLGAGPDSMVIAAWVSSVGFGQVIFPF